MARTKSKGVISLILPHHSPLKAVCARTQDRKLEVGADVEAMEGTAYWFAPFGLLSLFSYNTQDHKSRDGSTPKNELGPPASVINQANAPQANRSGLLLN